MSQDDQSQVVSEASFGTENPDTVRFINENDDIVPPYFRKHLAWGFMNRTVGMSKFEPQQARAAIFWMESEAIMMKMSIPSRQVTSQFINDIDNARFFFRMNVNRATVPQHERGMIVKQVREAHTTMHNPGRGGGWNPFRR